MLHVAVNSLKEFEAVVRTIKKAAKIQKWTSDFDAVWFTSPDTHALMRHTGSPEADRKEILVNYKSKY